MSSDRDEFVARECEVAGRSEVRCVAHTARGQLVWTHVRQLDGRGELSFEFATDFTLDGNPVADRQGERLLDADNRRVDGSDRPT